MYNCCRSNNKKSQSVTWNAMTSICFWPNCQTAITWKVCGRTWRDQPVMGDGSNDGGNLLLMRGVCPSYWVARAILNQQVLARNYQRHWRSSLCAVLFLQTGQLVRRTRPQNDEKLPCTATALNFSVCVLGKRKSQVSILGTTKAIVY